MADTDKHQPHVFVEVDQLPFSPPLPRGVRQGAIPPAVHTGKSAICELCHKPKSHKIHIDGEVEADAESPHWG
jgi:hypothetical protein